MPPSEEIVKAHWEVENQTVQRKDLDGQIHQQFLKLFQKICPVI